MQLIIKWNKKALISIILFPSSFSKLSKNENKDIIYRHRVQEKRKEMFMSNARKL